ncbi:hypothetical protein FJ981_28140 [Mesorhizobium sp. B1-1-4]|uniref:hypothetical protein n=1 Tax=Mesorhizobium sp. B1-1-4 TaxID=2589980 RepID=UPI00112B9ADA|nr:hypothetical protein [Mesorhizobium sp. B1-1-4]TPN44469.1 hypothetical protein FJ981_28140 [Mesorhizobium sp. B1-1-4]
MAVFDDYVTGTVSVANGSPNVTGVGTAWTLAAIRPGDEFKRFGRSIAILSVTDDTHLVLAEDWPDTALVGSAYRIRFQPDGSRLTAQAAALIEALANGNLASIADLVSAANTLPYFTGAGVAALADFTTAGRALLAAADADGQLSELGFSTFAKTLVNAADAATARAKIAALGGALGTNDNRLLRADGTGGATAQGSAVTLDDSGNLSGIANLSGATATLSGLLTVNGGQIKFPAVANPSADANTLDDYEEGSYTPTPAFGGANVGMVAPVRSGRYIKIGALAVVWGFITLSAKGSSTGVASVTGIPFQASANASFYAGSLPFFGSTVGITVAGCAMPANGNALTLYSPPGGVWLDTNFNNTTSIMFAVAYEAA